MQYFTHGTWLQGEEMAYPDCGEDRKGRAICPDGQVRPVWAGIPDTYFSIPAHTHINSQRVTGWVTVDDALVDCPRCKGEWVLERAPDNSTVTKKCGNCQFGLVDSPTRGALLFHPNRVQEEAA